MIQVYDRKTKSYEEELIAGKKYIEWTYESPIGRNITELIAKRKVFSKLYGMYCDTKFSSKKIKSFVDDFDIDMNLSTKKINEFKSFNDFFVRKLNDEARPIDKNPDILVSPGDGRLTAYENINLENLVQIKGMTYSLFELINMILLLKSILMEYVLFLDFVLQIITDFTLLTLESLQKLML